MRATLRVTTAEGSRHFEVAEGQQALLGRGASCDIVVQDNSVSRRHCSLLLEQGVLHVTDLGSSHGVKKDKKLVAECVLSHGEEIEVGMAKLRYDAISDAESLSKAETQPSAALSAAPAHRDLVGETLGGYRVQAMLGAGGQAIVYSAEQLRLGREVALKVLRNPESGSTAEQAEAFLREARAAAALSDPSLVQVFDLGFDRNRHFLSMELVRGGSLATRIRRNGPMRWVDFEPILFDVLDALAVAHGAGIVHRDVKPANILLTLEGRAKLADLGLARGIGGEGDRSGTPAYMAPEQVKGSSVDARADLYALGCTIFHALTGAPPFVGRSKDILRQKFGEESPSLPSHVDAPASVGKLLAALLQRDPAARPADVRAVAAMLRPKEPSQREPATTLAPRRSRRPVRTSSGGGSAWHWVAALVALALLAFVILRLLPAP